MESKYIVMDNERKDFCAWSILEPATRKEVIEHFYSIGKHNEEFETLKKDYSFKYIMETWNVTIIRQDILNEQYKCPMCLESVYLTKQHSKGYFCSCINCDIDLYYFELKLK